MFGDRGLTAIGRGCWMGSKQQKGVVVMDRVMADCRRFESDSNCQLTIIGPADDVVAAAVQHAVASHGHEDTPEMREQLRAMLEPESAYVAGERTPEPFPA
jgi:Protein of unknown function (DUF1059)